MNFFIIFLSFKILNSIKNYFFNHSLLFISIHNFHPAISKSQQILLFFNPINLIIIHSNFYTHLIFIDIIKDFNHT